MNFIPKCPEATLKRIKKCGQLRMNSTQTPSGYVFDVSESGRHYKVELGNPHRCSCGKVQPCFHTLYVLMKDLKLSETDPRIWQRGMGEYELEMCLAALAQTNNCVFCHEEGDNLHKCDGCGDQFHIKCHELKCSVTKKPKNCCLKCGEGLQSSNSKEALKCKICTKACNVSYFPCILCDDFKVCRTCKPKASHPHALVEKLISLKPTAKPQHDISELQYREIKPEDYENLMRLDENSHPAKVLSKDDFEKLPVRVLTLIKRDCSTCCVCLENLKVRDKFIKLACGHLLHWSCGRKWLTESASYCPIDKKEVTV
ncbi:hypothetical protein AGDE_01643 [Angomonas deanei]|nr:hypothetical protein AGDE_01643 [Angomonas deanei]|eukprot:EPY42280.1 hypothetical protein AGDE_01643 [Angomonas deanei]